MQRMAHRVSRRVLAGLATAGLLALATPPALARSDVFQNLAGTWRGAGTITTSSGQTERIKCNVGYGAAAGGLSQNLVCASAAFRFNVIAQIVERGGNVSGTWSETTRGLSGALSGVVRGNQIVTTVTSSNFTASLTIVSSGNTQSVLIQSRGSEISRVAISFRR